jgi:purine-nucleoside phosphorylase
MNRVETQDKQPIPTEALFDPSEYLERIFIARDFLKERLPSGFTPYVALTLGSGGLGEVAGLIERVATIPYRDIPGFKETTVAGHEGNLIAGYIAGIPMIGFQGRKHYYEEGGQPNQVVALKVITFPVYVARALGAEIYIATNAAGGLNPDYKPGDLMVIASHNDVHFPNPLMGPQVDFMNPMRFQPQHNQYNVQLRKLMHQAGANTGQTGHMHEGVYCALTGPTYESRADSMLLRGEGVDAVGMSTIPEVIVASNIGMETCGFSLITNVVESDGTNATSHEEVMAALKNPDTKSRIAAVTQEFFRLLAHNT